MPTSRRKHTSRSILIRSGRLYPDLFHCYRVRLPFVPISSVSISALRSYHGATPHVVGSFFVSEAKATRHVVNVIYIFIYIKSIYKIPIKSNKIKAYSLCTPVPLSVPLLVLVRYGVNQTLPGLFRIEIL